MSGERMKGSDRVPRPADRGLSRPAKVTMKRRGFTLLEMLISLALMLIMYFMLTSPGAKSFQDKQKLACQTRLRNIHVALKLYALDHGGEFPSIPSATTSEAPLSLLIPKCTTDTSIFICPGSGHAELPAAEPFADRRISYAYYTGHRETDAAGQTLLSDAQINTASKAKGDPMFSADGKGPGANHHRFGGNVLFCDGHAETSKPQASFDLTLATNITLLNPKP